MFNLNEEQQFLYDEFFLPKLKKVGRHGLRLGDDKKQNAQIFVDYVSKANIKNINELMLIFYETFHHAGKEDKVKKFINPEGVNIKKTQYSDLCNTFLEEFLYDDGDEDLKAVKTKTCNEMLDKIRALMERKISGNMNTFYFNFRDTKKNIITENWSSYLSSKGYKMLALSLVSKDEEGKGEPLSQEQIVKMYTEFIKNEASKCNIKKSFMTYNSQTRNINLEWDIAVKFKEYLETFMIEETKNSEVIKRCQEKVEFLYNDYSLSEFKSCSTFDGQHSKFYQLVRDALNSPFNEESKKIISEFYKKMMEINKALCTTDKPNKIYVTNYFKVTDMYPSHTGMLISRLIRLVDEEKKDYVESAKKAGDRRLVREISAEFKSQIIDKDKLKQLQDTKTLINSAFCRNGGKILGFRFYTVFEPNRVDAAVEYVEKLTHFKKTISHNGIKEEELKRIPERVKEILIKEDLPLNVYCIKSVFDSLLNGDYPVYLPKTVDKNANSMIK